MAMKLTPSRFHLVDCARRGVLEGLGGSGLANKTPHPVRDTDATSAGKTFKACYAVEFGVAHPADFSHTSDTEQGEDVGRNRSAVPLRNGVDPRQALWEQLPGGDFPR